MVFFWARAEPHRLAIIQPEMVTSFQGLADAIESISDRMDRLGLDTAEPVAISIANPSYYLAAIFALFRCGFSVAPVNPRLYPHLRSVGIRNLIYDAHGQVLSGGRNVRFDMSWVSGATTTASERRYRERPAADGSMIFFTSGTTGLPKASVQAMVGLSERYSSPLTCANGDHTKVLIIPGLAGAFGFNRTCEVLYMGKTACFAPLGEAALTLISTFGIEVLLGSTQQMLSLADFHAKGTRYDLSSLKMLRVGGALLSPAAARRIKNNLCRNIVTSYASTEAGIVAMASYDAIAEIPGAVGFVSPYAELEIVDEESTVLPVGAEGRIRIRARQLVPNRGTGDSVQHPDDGWFYPGDIGRVSDQGMLCLTGRYSDVINCGGVKLSATRIEEIVEALPNIKEAAVCGVEGHLGLEEVWIAVVPQAPIDIPEIKRLLQEHDDVGVMVDEVFELKELPRTDLGKIQKYKLKEALRVLKSGEA